MDLFLLGFATVTVCYKDFAKVSRPLASGRALSTGWPKKTKPLPNNKKIVLNRIKAYQ